MKIRMMYGLLLVLVSVNLMGCFSARPEDIEAYVKPYQSQVTAENYVLEAGDKVEVLAAKIPEIHQQQDTVRTDGKIALPMYGEITAAGKTPLELADVIAAMVQKDYKNIGENAIIVRPLFRRLTEYDTKLYYVVGEVSRPGPKTYTGRDTAITAITAAHPVITAWEEKIQVVRPSVHEEIDPKIFELNYIDIIKHGDASKDVLLEEGDIIYVPPTPLAAVGNLIAEIVRPIGLALNPVVQVTRVSTGGF